MSNVTLRDVAAAAGVSVATVSTVLRGRASAGRIGLTTAERVRAAAAALEYQPNMIAQSLARRRSSTIVLGTFPSQVPYLASDRHPFYGRVLESIEVEAGEQGFDLLIPSGSQHSSAADYVANLRARHIAGALLVALDLDDPRVAALKAAEIPTVFTDLDVQTPYATSVKPDNVGGARQATDHLLHLGHRHIAIFCGAPNSLAAIERLAGYRQALQAAGLPPNPALTHQSYFSREEAYRDAVTYLRRGLTCTAIVAQSDEMAIGILQALQEHGLSVPGDVSLVGFDDIDVCPYLDPPLTTVQVDRAELGRSAVRRLVALIEGGARVVPQLVSTQLVVRGSAAPPSTGTPTA